MADGSRERVTAGQPPGRLIEGAFRYDLKMWVLTLGRERAFRREIVELARIREGERVLDLGCGTGGLAIAAKRRVSLPGIVHGVDPSREMIDRARGKARRARLEVHFATGVAQDLPLPDSSVDVVMATLVLHHLPHDALLGSLREIRRVLVPGGRFLAVDIDLDDPSNPRGSPHAHAREVGATFDLDHVETLTRQVGLEVDESGPLRFRLFRLERLRYVLAVEPTSG